MVIVGFLVIQLPRVEQGLEFFWWRARDASRFYATLSSSGPLNEDKISRKRFDE